GRGPVEADGGSADADVVRAQQGRERPRDAAQKRLRSWTRAALLRLDFLPSDADLTGRAERRLALGAFEDVWMTPHELVPNMSYRVCDREMPGLGLELREKNGLEHEVAELLAERRVIVAIDRLEHFVGLLEHERLQRVDRLLAIPRAALGSAKQGHDLDEP